MLQRLTQHAVEGDVRPQDVSLLPAVLLQLLDLGPEAVQVLLRGRGEGTGSRSPMVNTSVKAPHESIHFIL